MMKEESFGAHENENGEDEYDDDDDESKNNHVCMNVVCYLIHSSNVRMVEAVLPYFVIK